jgi:hypothetical protein
MSTFSCESLNIINNYKPFLYKFLGEKEGHARAFRLKIKNNQLLFPNKKPKEIDLCLFKILKTIHNDITILKSSKNKQAINFLTILQKKIDGLFLLYKEIENEIINPMQEIARHRINLIHLEKIKDSGVITSEQAEKIYKTEDSIKKLYKYLSDDEQKEITNGNYWLGKLYDQ